MEKRLYGEVLEHMKRNLRNIELWQIVDRSDDILYFPNIKDNVRTFLPGIISPLLSKENWYLL